MVTDADISACLKSNYLTGTAVDCTLTQAQRWDHIHSNSMNWYYACGGYSEGGIGPHEAEMRSWSDAICAAYVPPPPPCEPAWQCEKDSSGQLTGYEVDGCGNRRANAACIQPEVPPTQPYEPQKPSLGGLLILGLVGLGLGITYIVFKK